MDLMKEKLFDIRTVEFRFVQGTRQELQEEESKLKYLTFGKIDILFIQISFEILNHLWRVVIPYILHK